MPHVAVGSRTLHYERRGSGQPLLLIQGMAGHHRLWGEPFLRELERDFDVVAYDHRGVGASTDLRDADFGIADLAADAVMLLDALGWDAAHVMGISMGGMVAQHLAVDHAPRLRSLVLGCTYPGGPGSTLAAPGPVRMLQAIGLGNVDVALRTAFAANLSRAFAASEAHFEQFREATLSVTVPVPVIMRQAKAAFGHDTSARLPGVTVPTLVLHGTADEMLDHANGERIAELMPTATLHTFDGVGHLFWWEQPEATASLVRAHCLG
ncbi:MAG TPA: alpha/beta hydrolase [Jatrophihabitans sp.]|jgi:pimeloyl-ACP methyl ester carboxylesterase|uniref:alpha/beta fold hydrolase n=1 Tax=Jatrophihabitans sp. TaxID=1932789 RepID=UPI002E083FAF|nr:alpha/beta hydrolase [Jatrophihabitans sp.]